MTTYNNLARNHLGASLLWSEYGGPSINQISVELGQPGTDDFKITNYLCSNQIEAPIASVPDFLIQQNKLAEVKN